MLSLNKDEKNWLEQYRRLLNERYPGLVEDLIIFGSKARGDAHPDSDLDVILLIKEGDWKLKMELCEPGYELSFGTDAVPSIIVYTINEWSNLKQEESIFQECVDLEGISFR